MISSNSCDSKSSHIFQTSNFKRKNTYFDHKQELEFHKSSGTNSSTLSLHITAYENSVDGSCNNVHHVMTTKDSILHPYKFPRQQNENNEGKKPEVMQFKASQKLCKPNDIHWLSKMTPNGLLSSIRNYGTRKYGCWKCGSDAVKKPEIMCSSCNTIQPIVHGLNYFDYFNLKHDFVIDQNELKKKFREIQTSVHPDKYGLHDEEVKKMADEHSSFANHAYKTLSDTRQRALYMLEVSHVGESSPDPELAMQMMELNEEIEESNDTDELKAKLKEVEEHINDIVHTMSSHFEEGKAEEAKKDLDKLRYFDRTKKLILKKLQ